MLTINIDIDYTRQIVKISDNAGGVDETELKKLITPGESTIKEDDNTIGIFGVGSKRAVVYLSEDIKIYTRRSTGKTYLIELTDAWLKNDTWELPYYSYDDDIPENSTVIELQKLRVELYKKDYLELKKHLSVTYAKFLLKEVNLEIKFNDKTIKPKIFENWAYPVGFPPQSFEGELELDSQKIKYALTGGLTNSRANKSAEIEDNDTILDYGVYFYCNDRLILKNCRTHQVGFVKGAAGQPHNSMTLARVIVEIKGSSKLMPWNSSKSDINYAHKVFDALRKDIVDLVEQFTKLSRKLSSVDGGWKSSVFPHKTGKIKKIKSTKSKSIKAHLPPLPTKPRVKIGDSIKRNNAVLAKDKPWTIGLYESIIATDTIFKTKLSQRNRICIIILDSALEIGFKQYLMNESGNSYSANRFQTIMSSRVEVHREIKNCTSAISEDDWRKIEYYYKIRCEFVHKRSEHSVEDERVLDFKEIVEKVFNILFSLDFSSPI